MADLQPDLVLLLPPADEVELVHACEIVRDGTDRPLLVLSEQKEELLIARALASGVDEYLVTPMGNRELAARIEAMLRRIRRTAGAGSGRDLGVLRLAPEDNSVLLNGRRVPLSPIEFRLLVCLASTPGVVVSHQTLMTRVWGDEYVDSRNYLRLYIRYLREKLEEDPTIPQLIVSEWGVGYRLQLPEVCDLSRAPHFVPAHL
jgi:two-component system KDP operon response regulator KdpE